MPDTNMNYSAADVTLETSATTGALDEALAKAQGEIDIASKDSVNPAFKSKYANLTSVWEACRPALAKNSIALTQWPLSSADNRLHIITRVAHKGEWMQARFSIPVDKANAHGVGSAITYAKRFTLSAVLGIVADDDDDGNAASHKPGAPGTAGAGTQFRPERRSPGMAQTESLKVDPADRGMVQGNGESQYEADKAKKAAAPINTPAAAGSAIKRIEWVKASVAYLVDKDEHVARDWWVENKARIDVIETALPTEYERLLDSYNEALERKVPA